MSVAPACGNDSGNGHACSPSDHKPCSCDDGLTGLASCAASGDGYSACVCAPGGTGGASGSDGGAKADASAGLPFMSACMTNAECASGSCYPYNAKGPHCTKACTSDGDCPSPSPGCAPVGVCKAP